MGRFTLRLPETLHIELELRAQQEGVSLNQYVVYALTRQVATTYTIHPLSEASVKEQQARYDKLLAGLGQPDLAETKAFLADRESAERESGLTDEMITRVEAKMAESAEGP
jgi:hypothetical protein